MRRAKAVINRDKEAENTFTTSTGRQVKLTPVNFYQLVDLETVIREEHEGRGEPISPPVREVVTATGATEEWQLDGDNLELETLGDPEQNKADWEAHLDARRRLQVEVADTQMDFLILGGVECDPDADKEWLRWCKRFRLPIPDDPLDRKLEYVTKYLLKTPEDIQLVSFQIMTISKKGAPGEGKIQAALDSFRDTLQEEDDDGGGNAGGEDTPQRAPGEGRPMAGERPVHGHEDGEGMGDEAVGI